jgi:hypothetical protein
MGTMDVQNIKAEWAKRRCEPAILFSAFLYKPASDPRSSSTFAGDNFQFCMRSLIDSVFAELLAPVLGVFSQQMAAASTTGSVLQSLRNQIGNTFRSFSGILDEFFQTYVRGTHQLGRMTAILRQAMLKVSASVVSTVFLGMSLMISLLNVKDFIIKVVIIIMTIMIAMIVLLFFALVPFMPIIFTTIAILTGAGLGGSVGGMAGAFCIDPNAQVLLATGEYRRLADIRVGDRLGAGCGTVEGVLETDTLGELYNVEGVIMAASHLLYFGKRGTPIFAHEYPGAIRVAAAARPDRLIILNTTSHTIPLVRTHDTILLAADWEEIQDDAGRALWETLVWKILNGSDHVTSQEVEVGQGVALFAPTTQVYVKGRGAIPISDVKRGMIVQDMYGYTTTVLGVFTGIAEEPFVSMTPGVRCFIEGRWAYRPKGDEAKETTPCKVGYSLVTNSGSFCITTLEGTSYAVRDFTEVGWLHLEETYESTRSHLATLLPHRSQ